MKTVVVGGGVIGASIALELLTRGHDVIVVNRFSTSGASAAAGGMLAPQAEAADPGPMLDLSLRSRTLYPAWVQRLEAETSLNLGYQACGLLNVALTDAQAHDLEAGVAWQRANGLRATFLSGDDARALEPNLAAEVVAAAHFPDDHAVDAAALTHALRERLPPASKVIGTVRRLTQTGGKVTGVLVDTEQTRRRRLGRGDP